MLPGFGGVKKCVAHFTFYVGELSCLFYLVFFKTGSFRVDQASNLSQNF